jgi:hypothetical protein
VAHRVVSLLATMRRLSLAERASRPPGAFMTTRNHRVSIAGNGSGTKFGSMELALERSRERSEVHEGRSSAPSIVRGALHLAKARWPT